ncbi:MAG: extracellular solute-binding protein [Treponema sp.]|nr:extracellular solute-binding protein [Treponema sp.]
MRLLKNSRAHKSVGRSLLLFVAVLGFSTSLAISLASCREEKNPTVIIWTDRPELASYAELFNTTHSDTKAMVIYKDSPISSLPPMKGEYIPDLIVGPWLKSSTSRKYFKPVDYLFNEKKLIASDYYEQLLNYGVLNEKQYLVPLSFNLPAIVFTKANEGLIENEHIVTLELLRDSAEKFNRRNRNDEYTSIGYAPSWDTDFMYMATRLNGASYQEKGNGFSWNEKAIAKTVSFFRNWTSEINTSTAAEQNFQFKFLYMSKYRQLSNGKCAFAYMTSDELFALTNEQAAGLTFRWLVKDNSSVMVEDSIITMGIYKYASNIKGAEIFMEWLSSEETQQALIQRTEKMHLDTVAFGIAGGFSALKNVNANVFPTHYRVLLGNLPTEQNLDMPNILPYRWPELKAKVIVPYLQDSSNTENDLEEVDPIDIRIEENNKVY